MTKKIDEARKRNYVELGRKKRSDIEKELNR